MTIKRLAQEHNAVTPSTAPAFTSQSRFKYTFNQTMYSALILG